MALTGGIASGKSAVSAMLGELGAVIIDADLLAREVVSPGTAGLSDVVAAFGTTILTSEGALDRPALAEVVFSDAHSRKRLESIVHPLVFERIVDLEAHAPADSIIVHDIPLLAEGGRAGEFDAVIVVDAEPQAQLARMVEYRAMSVADAKARMAAQASRAERLAIATFVVDNNGTLADLRRQVEGVWEQLLDMKSNA